MLLIPAIDLKDGRCVRLRQGDMNDATVFSDDPAAMARKWLELGARRLHLVDLNGAFAGAPVNGSAVRSITHAFPDLPVQIGGGIRTRDSAARYLDMGVRWVIIGTQAVKAGLTTYHYRGSLNEAHLDAADGQAFSLLSQADLAGTGWSTAPP